MFKIIEAFPKYECSTNGEVRNAKTLRILKPALNKQNGYLYVCLRKDNKTMVQPVHKLIATTFISLAHHQEKLIVDHINRVRDDNKVENLRWITRQQNSMNASKRKNATSKYKGVSRHVRYSKKEDKITNKWQAAIKIGGSLRHLGYYDNEEDACRAYNQAAMEIDPKHYHVTFPTVNVN